LKGSSYFVIIQILIRRIFRTDWIFWEKKKIFNFTLSLTQGRGGGGGLSLEFLIEIRHRWVSILNFISPRSDIEVFSHISDHSNIGLNFDIRYRIDQSDIILASIRLIWYPISRIIHSAIPTTRKSKIAQLGYAVEYVDTYKYENFQTTDIARNVSTVSEIISDWLSFSPISDWSDIGLCPISEGAVSGLNVQLWTTWGYSNQYMQKYCRFLIKSIREAVF
jgi:hypothetical protein